MRDIIGLRRRFRRGVIGLVAAAIAVWSGCGDSEPSRRTPSPAVSDGPFYVNPGDSIQSALDAAALARQDKRVIVRAGEYHPQAPAFAFVSLTARHNGVQLLAEGDVTLSAQRDPSSESPPAANVNHVIYCGDGLGPETLIEGFIVTGADGFVTQEGIPVESFGVRAPALQRGLFFLTDGGGLKVFGRSAPTIRNMTFVDNRVRLCGGAVSIEQQGFNDRPVVIEHCTFLRNRCPGTGAAVDVLEGGAVRIENCLFAENIANFGMEQVAREFGLTYNAEHGCGALTVFPNARAHVTRCTFTRNWNGIDDRGIGNVYDRCLLWMNDATDGSRPGGPYEFDIVDASGVQGCFIHGPTNDLRQVIDPGRNRFDPPDPEFDERYVPRNPEYGDVGWRPVPASAVED